MMKKTGIFLCKLFVTHPAVSPSCFPLARPPGSSRRPDSGGGGSGGGERAQRPLFFEKHDEGTWGV